MDFDKYWDQLKRIVKANPKGKPLDKDGRFYPDPTPMAPPVGQQHVADIDMFEVMRSRIRNEISINAQMDGAESFEEADDFYIEDDFEPFSPYELIVEQARPDGPSVLGPEPQPEQPAKPPVNSGPGGTAVPPSPAASPAPDAGKS